MAATCHGMGIANQESTTVNREGDVGTQMQWLRATTLKYVLNVHQQERAEPLVLGGPERSLTGILPIDGPGTNKQKNYKKTSKLSKRGTISQLSLYLSTLAKLNF